MFVFSEIEVYVDDEVFSTGNYIISNVLQIKLLGYNFEIDWQMLLCHLQYIIIRVYYDFKSFKKKSSETKYPDLWSLSVKISPIDDIIVLVT